MPPHFLKPKAFLLVGRARRATMVFGTFKSKAAARRLRKRVSAQQRATKSTRLAVVSRAKGSSSWRVSSVSRIRPSGWAAWRAKHGRGGGRRR
jgi:hypothetical protein